MPANRVKLSSLATEERNPRSLRLDLLTAKQIAELMVREVDQVNRALRGAIPQMGRAVDAIVKQMSRGGRLIYIGSGTSGRIGILDAVECVPTFNTKPGQIQGIIAGGPRACYQAVEASEDDAGGGRGDLRKLKLTARDVVVGIAASGRTPYTCGALKYAKSVGATTVALVNSPKSPMKRLAGITIEVLTGPEVLTGSTRLKAGTAQKLVCNILSTASMVRLGAVYSNWMIHVHLKNEKLIARGIKILMGITGATESAANKALAQSHYDLKVAAVMLAKKCDVERARILLHRSKENLRAALQMRTTLSSDRSKSR
ncbi:MAG: N-acetylmuramic acid 6-phosphate etherase [Acidobacteriia bacterium]|nr:N-acetylmuramic acid 6-phosphate etherase [Terriglobia bacterium]